MCAWKIIYKEEHLAFCWYANKLKYLTLQKACIEMKKGAAECG